MQDKIANTLWIVFFTFLIGGAFLAANQADCTHHQDKAIKSLCQ